MSLFLVLTFHHKQGCSRLYFVQYAIRCPSSHVHTPLGPLPAPKNISHTGYFLSFPLNSGAFPRISSCRFVSLRVASCRFIFTHIPASPLMFVSRLNHDTRYLACVQLCVCTHMDAAWSTCASIAPHSLCTTFAPLSAAISRGSPPYH